MKDGSTAARIYDPKHESNALTIRPQRQLINGGEKRAQNMYIVNTSIHTLLCWQNDSFVGFWVSYLW